MGVNDTENPGSQGLIPVREEVSTTQPNPLEIANQRLIELSQNESLNESDRNIIEKSAEWFRVYRTELNKRYEFLKSQGFNPDSNPLLLYYLCNRLSNDIFLLGGIDIDRINPKMIVIKPGETESGATLDSQIRISPEGLAKEFEALGYLEPGEDLTIRINRIGGGTDRLHERLDSNNGESIMKSFRERDERKDAKALPDSNRREKRTVYLASPLLGPGILAGISIESTPDFRDCKVALEGPMDRNMVAIYGTSTQESVAQALVRCAK